MIGPGDKPLEIQIRTHEMHRHAELGVAAHWAYKEARKGHDAEFQRRIDWMRNFLELKSEGEDATDILERFKAEFEPVHIYVLTPQAKVIELAKGATPLDFAYAVHSQIGHRCRGARVNGRIVPLSYTLNSGETVEILTQKNATPSRDWLSPHQGYLTTARARNRVRQWFKQQDHDLHVQSGRAAPGQGACPPGDRREAAARPTRPALQPQAGRRTCWPLSGAATWRWGWWLVRSVNRGCQRPGSRNPGPELTPNPRAVPGRWWSKAWTT